MPSTSNPNCPRCAGATALTDCGVFVCRSCRHHLGLVRCFCGWAESGGNGRTELEALGETIDEEPEPGNPLTNWAWPYER